MPSGSAMAEAKTALANEFAKIIEALTQKAPGYAFSLYKNRELLLSKGLPSYLEANYHKCETVRTLIRRDAPVALDSIYVAPSFHMKRNVVTSEELIQAIGGELQPTVITGLAGSGKSVFLKRLFRKSIEDGHTFYPIFFELRSLASDADFSLQEVLFESVKKFAEGFTAGQFSFGLKRGSFFIIIDAFDESPVELRDRLSDEIVDFRRKYPRCPIVISSRPSEVFSTWEGFVEAKLQPFSKEQCISFISKIDFDAERKRQFKDALEADLFAKHKEFLSTHLLASMMLLPYDEYGEIPAKRHVFLKSVFKYCFVSTMFPKADIEGSSILVLMPMVSSRSLGTFAFFRTWLGNSFSPETVLASML